MLNKFLNIPSETSRVELVIKPNSRFGFGAFLKNNPTTGVSLNIFRNNQDCFCKTQKQHFAGIRRIYKKNTGLEVYFLINLQAGDLQRYQKRDSGTSALKLSEKETPAQCFLVNFEKLLRKPFLKNRSWRLLLKARLSS